MATESRHKQRPLRTLIVFFAVVAALFAIMALANTWTPKLGLDLRGGTTITLTARNTTGSGAVDFIAVGKQPHGLAVWPQPGRYNLGHTGNLR